MGTPFARFPELELPRGNEQHNSGCRVGEQVERRLGCKDTELGNVFHYLFDEQRGGRCEQRQTSTSGQVSMDQGGSDANLVQAEIV